VAGFVFGVGDVGAVGGIEFKMVNAVTNAVDGAGEVAQTAEDEHAEVRVLADDGGEPARDAGITVARIVIHGATPVRIS